MKALLWISYMKKSLLFRSTMMESSLQITHKKILIVEIINLIILIVMVVNKHTHDGSPRARSLIARIRRSAVTFTRV